MEREIPAVFYDGVTSKPQEATVRVSDLNSLEVVLPDGARFQWPLEHKGMEWERSSSMLRLSFGDHPRRVLLIRDELFIKSFVLRMRYTGRQGGYDRILSFARSGPVIFFLGVVALLVCAYLWILPWAAERLVLVVPSTLDERIGEAAYQQMAFALNEDRDKTIALQAFGDAMDLSPSFEPRYHVVEDAQVNAFALPGGHIVVFTGILEKMSSAEELAALLAHEATHVEKRHSTRMMARSMAGYLFLSLLIGDVNAVVTLVAENANALRNLDYGRGLESEADGVGQEMLFANDLDPMAMVRLLELLEREAIDVPEVLAFLSSHPLTEDRITAARERAGSLGVPQRPNDRLGVLFEQLHPTTDQPTDEMPSSDN
ncbi:MAG: M48 family metallopeptidase [Flavobacteriales bacterium]|nr:M48 family metallopeptidase [Flavobacteriales bacterium]MCB9164486.1 M48 family metallopeptidase [Flavobacteriales bacterium]